MALAGDPFRNATTRLAPMPTVWNSTMLRGSVVATFLLAAVVGCGSGGSNTGSATTQKPLLNRLATDTFSNPGSQHATEVEPSIAASGAGMVAVFQVGRFFDGGAAALGFATSADRGASWGNGLINGITVLAGGTYLAVSDPSIAYDQAHSRWLLTSLAISTSSDTVVVSRTTDGLNWAGPIVISNSPDSDKDWIACDNTQTSPYYGHCYVEWDDPSQNGLIWMSTSSDGGMTWGPAQNTADSAGGIGGVPVVQPNGTVIVPIQDATGTHVVAYTSLNGGVSWTAPVTIASISDHQVAGGLRDDALPMSAVDGSGTVYVVWQDCRFRANCASNDIVMSTSADGLSWTAPVRIPIDAVGSTVDHFLPAIAADPATAVSSAHLTLVYHFYPTAACLETTCSLGVAYVTSQDGGVNWSTSGTLASGMSLDWLANTKSGRMVGDYVGVTYSLGKAYPAIAVARANAGLQLDEAIYTTTDPLIQAQALAGVQREQPRPEAHSDHPPRHFYDLEHRYPVKPPDR